eukprot:scaffold101687_cov33-Phaeocystis_antarctica.AAC.1
MVGRAGGAECACRAQGTAPTRGALRHRFVCRKTGSAVALKGRRQKTNKGQRAGNREASPGVRMSCGNEASPWTHGFSPEGHAYYFNTVTGESSWTAPPEHRSSEVTMPLTPSMGAMPSMGGTTDVSDLFGPASDGDSELFGAAGAPVETPFTGAMEPDACAGFGAGGATEASSELFSGGGAPDSAAFASAPAPAASELFGSAPDTGPGLFASAPAPAASELFGSAPDTGPGLFASAPAPAASE